MRTPALPSPRRIAAGAGLALLAAGLTPLAASANPAGTNLVISEVYGAGGNTGAPYNADFVELFNPTGAPVELLGDYLVYRSSTGSPGGAVALRGTVPAGGTFLVRMSGTGANGAVVTADQVASPAVSMAAGGGQVFLTDNGRPVSVSGNVAGKSGIVDMVGLDGATTFEKASGPVATAASSAQRSGGLDTDDNASDFTLAAPTPTAGGGGYTAVDAGVRTVAAVQGPSDTSPFLYDTVTTRGVVTAAYPAGGLNGFFMQTEGTGAGTDGTQGSDAVFVFGNSAMAAAPTVGDFVEVVGVVSEFGGLTQVTPAAGGVTKINEQAHTDPVAQGVLPTSEATREAHEGEVFDPLTGFTVTNTYSLNNFGEIGLATGDKPLIAPTEVALPGSPEAAAVEADNSARSIVLDDGSSANYNGSASGTPSPWITPSRAIRVGAAADLVAPVVLDFRNNVWKVQPQAQVTGLGESVATFGDTRPANAAPQPVGGDLQIATFNVLNYFPTTGEEFDALPNTTCTWYSDRAGNRIGVNQCTPDGPRGAATTASFERQQAKTVTAINGLGAEIVSLEELENSAKFGKDRDFAISKLVTALNGATAPGTWAFVPSPPEADRPTVAQEDVIRTGFIYKPAAVRPVGISKILIDEENFDNAREPLAQVFKQVGTPDAEAFTVIVNHFKSKGSGIDDGTGQGNANPDRVGQANALSAFADSFATARGTDAVFLVGDFNSYTQEDPMQVLYGAGYEAIESDTPGEETYSFGGLVGSLDHVLANEAALTMVTGADVWNINSPESLAYQYGRYNYNVTQFFDATDPFGASDHDPEIVGIAIDSTEVQIIGSNDYHGRLAAGPRLAAYVKAARAANPNTVFAAAGDLLGATTFESFIQHDKPTIDVMNEAGLDVSAVGNHEFDAGYDDLVNRIMKPYDATTNPEGGAKWKYLGANVKFKADDSPALDGTWIKDFGPVEVGFIGAVTEDLPSLVGAGGIADIKVTDIVDATNAAATDLKTEGADVVVLLVHEGASSTSLASATNPASAFGEIVNNVSPDVDAIVSGHTHLAYNHSVPVPAWATEGRAVTERPVVSAGQYGENLNKLVFTVDNATGKVQAKTQEIVPFANFPATGDAATQAIVNDANAKAAVLGAQPLGKISAGFSRAKFVTGAENRGGESTLGNLVAEVQRWATGTQIAFMNPGGLRADMMGTGTDYPRTVTYKNAADVQPFANTLMTMGLSGASIKKVLEQQWQRTAGGTVPSRPFLKLGVSEGFEYTYDPTRPEGDRITGMTLNDVAIEPGTTYQVAANSFLASGTGDNFFAFSEATGKRDSGKVDLQTMVDYMAELAPATDPLDVDFSQRAIGVKGVAGDYAVGETVTLDLTSLAMTGAGDKQDATVAVEFDGRPVGDFPVDNTANPAGDGNSNDEAGKTTVSFRVPAVDAGGTYDVVVTGATTGTSLTIPVKVQAPTKVASTVTATATPSTIVAQTGTSTIAVEVTAPGGTPTGTVAALLDGQVIGGAELVDGKADVPVGPFDTAGAKDITIRYYGDAATLAGEAPVSLTVTPAPVVEKSDATVTATVEPTSVQAGTGAATVKVQVASSGQTPTGAVVAMVDGKVVGGRELVAGKTAFTVGPFANPGTKVITVKYFGDDATKAGETTVSLTVTAAPVEEKAAASVTTTVTPASVAVKDGRATVSVTVSKAVGVPTGAVLALIDGSVVGAGQLVGGTVDITLAPFATVGLKSVELRYLGDDTTKPATTTASVDVVKAEPSLKVKAPKKVEKGSRATIVVTVRATGFTPSGTVTVKVAGKKVTKALKRGETTIRVRLTRLGKNKVVVTYNGDDLTESASATRIIRVQRG